MISPLPWLREVVSPLTGDMLAPMDPLGVVQFSGALTNGDYATTLAQWLADYPKVVLRACGGYDGTITNLDFLRFFPQQHARSKPTSTTI